MAAPAAAGDTPALQAVMAQLAAQRHAYARFTQQQTLALLERPLQSSGELRYDAPDQLEQRILTPKPEVLRYDGGEVSVERGRRSYRIDVQRYPQLLPLLEGLRATLSGNLDQLRHDFHLQFQGDPRHWQLDLVPVDAAAAAVVRSVRIDGQAAQLRRIEVQQANGDHLVMLIEPVP